MEDALHAIAFALFAVLLGVGSFALRAHPRRLWAGAWSAILVGGFGVTAGWLPPATGLFVLLVFAVGQLAGALAVLLGRAPAWVTPAGVGLGLLTALEGTFAGPGPITQLGVACASLLCVATAGVLVEAARRAEWNSRLLALTPLLLATAAAPMLDTGTGEIPLGLRAYWVFLIMVGFSLQLRTEDYLALRSEKGLSRKRLQDLELQRERFKALTESAFDMVAELDDDENFLYASPRYEEVLGVRPETLVGRPARERLHPDDLPEAERFASLAGGLGRVSGFMSRVRHEDGHYVWMEHAAREYITPAGERRWVLSSRDAAQRRAQEEDSRRTQESLREQVSAQSGALQASEARFRALADHAPELISEFDASGAYLFANESFRELLGIDPVSLIGRSPQELVHPDDLAASRQGMEQAYQQQGEAHRVHRLRHADGSWRWFDNTGRAYHTAKGELRFVSIGRDVTEARRQEEERLELEAHVQQAQRQESLSVLAGGIAHDFNNLLSVILGNVQLLESDLEVEPEEQRRLERIRSATRHATALTQQLLAYTGQSSRELLPLDPAELLAESEDLLRAALGPRCRLEIHLPEDLPELEADPTEIRQVMVNLVTNACEALGSKGGVVHLGAREVSAASLGAARPSGGNGATRWVALEVTDHGPGMAKEVRQRILEPFYSTKEPGRGLGLAMVHGIVRAHSGLLQVESEPGAGSRFRVLLPSTSPPRDAAAPAPEAEEAPKLGGRVLVVDDDPPVRELAQIFLERAGFEVESVGGGQEALERLHKQPPLDCMLLDLAMPDLNGAEVLRILRTEHPSLSVVIGTGFSGRLAEEHMDGQRAQALLHKPYEPELLVETIRRVLRDARDEGSSRG